MHRTLFLLTLLTACARSPVPPLENPGVSSKTGPEGCGVLPHGCVREGACPEVVLPLGDGCTMSPKSLQDLDLAVHELVDTPLLTKLVVVGPTLGCANAVRAVMEGAGVTHGRVQVAVEENRAFISFAVEAWNERDCRTGALSKVPLGK